MNHKFFLPSFLCFLLCMLSCGRKPSYPPPSGDFYRDIKNVERYLRRKGIDKDHLSVYVEYTESGYQTHIFIGDSNLDNLEWIDPKMNLRSLTLYNAKITNLNPLHSQIHLESLNINGSLVEDISAVTNFTHLEIFECVGTHVSSLKPLEQLKNLQELDIRRIPCRNMDGVPTSAPMKISLTCGDGKD